VTRATSNAREWATSGLDLYVDSTGPGGLRETLERRLRDAIAGGRLQAGTRLPSTRSLAQDLGISRGTVLEAYTHLAAEGWIRGRRGSGTVVAPIGIAGPAGDGTIGPAAEAWRFDLREGRPDPGSFPRAAWLRALRRALASAPDSALGLGDALGRPELREQLATYLARARGLRVRPDRILITTGFTQSLTLVSRALAAAGVTTVAMEDPCMRDHRAAVAAAGHAIVPLPVDAGGARIEGLRANARGVGAVVLTPNRHHPLGMPLAPARRSELLEWARATGTVVIEDDYDGEFRYDGPPIGALQGLEPGRVVYAGTTSKTLAPGIRLGWLVLPPDLLEPALAQKRLLDWQTGVLEQLALAELIRSGEYDRHIRKMRLRYRRRRDLLVDALRRDVPGAAIGGGAAGLNLHLLLADAEAERELLDAASGRGIAINGLATSGYRHRARDVDRAALIVGYAAPPEHAYAATVKALMSTLRAGNAALCVRFAP
jgi:GntR family transcriptional regulator/MocR family aminotransferase